MRKKHLKQDIALLLIAGSLFFFVQLRTANARDTFTMAFWNDPEDLVAFRYAELIYEDAFGRLGFKFQYKVMPPIRSSIEANRGNVDGEPARVASYTNTYTNLIKVDEPVFLLHVMAYAINNNIQVNNWEDLRGSDFRVEYYRGVDITSKRLKELVKHDMLTSSSDPTQSLNKMILNRIDLYIGIHERIAPLLKKPQFKNRKIRIAGKLEDIQSYPMLHKRHIALVPQLEKILREMKADKLFEKYWKQALDSQNKP